MKNISNSGFLIILLLLFGNKISRSQTLYGFNGLITIPTAEIFSDGQFTAGISLLHKNSLEYSKKDSDKLVGYLSLGFLPFAELSLRLTRNIKPSETEAIGDRTPSIRIKLTNEDQYLPSILFGWHDVLSVFGGVDASNFSSAYLVMTKNINPGLFPEKINFSLGYGSKVFSARNYQFIGLFGGITIVFLKNIEIMGEYDSKRFNTGIRFTLLNKIKLIGSMMDLKHFSGGIALSLNL